MCFFASLIPATVFTVLGYVVLFCASKSEGGLQTFGWILATWVFIIAVCFPLFGLYVTLSGMCPLAHMMQSHMG